MCGKQLEVTFPQNQTQYQPYWLDLAAQAIKTVGDLRVAISRRLYLPPNCITIKYEQRILEQDQVQVSDLSLELANSITVLVSEPIQVAIPNAKPLIIGGLDFTNVKQVQELFGMKKQERRQEKKQQRAVQVVSRGREDRQERGEVDFGQKYKNELIRVKNQLEEIGVKKDEEFLLVQLVNYNGNVDMVINAALD